MSIIEYVAVFSLFFILIIKMLLMEKELKKKINIMEGKAILTIKNEEIERVDAALLPMPNPLEKDSSKIDGYFLVFRPKKKEHKK